MNTRILTAAALAMALTGCASQQNLYHWGEYETLVYKMYNEPGAADPQTQIAELTADIEQAEQSGKKVAPGIYAHLGYMYALANNPAKSQAAFATEKQLFPESSQFIDRLLNKAQTQGEAQ